MLYNVKHSILLITTLEGELVTSIKIPNICVLAKQEKTNHQYGGLLYCITVNGQTMICEDEKERDFAYNLISNCMLNGNLSGGLGELYDWSTLWQI